MPTDLKPAWSSSDLRRPGASLVALVVLVLVTAIATITACNVHEIAHAATATLLGWEVEQVHLCLPGSGSVEYSVVGNWAGNLQGYAGGLVAAVFLLVTYTVVIDKREKPLTSPNWWAAGLGMLLPVGPQIGIGLLEGLVRPGEDYTARYAGVIVPLVVMSMAVVMCVYVWRWRAVWRRQRHGGG